jgi:hypothetical protein
MMRNKQVLAGNGHYFVNFFTLIHKINQGNGCFIVILGDDFFFVTMSSQRQNPAI